MKVRVRSDAVSVFDGVRVRRTQGLWSVLTSGVFSMDEDSLSRDCEPFFESDAEEESTDGKRSTPHAA